MTRSVVSRIMNTRTRACRSTCSATERRAAGAQMARLFGARLHVVHVVPPVTDPGPADALVTAIAQLGGELDVMPAV